jgi:predicted thioesterase
MKNICTSLVAACLTLGFALPALAAPVMLPAGTRVEVHVVNPISSGDATVGQRFTFQAAAPVIVGNRVVIQKGASGTGQVVRVSKAQGKSAGEITLDFQNIHSVDGTLVALTEDAKRFGNPEKGKASTATIAATIALGPLGLFAHNMVKGKDVNITPSQTFHAWVKSNTSVTVP